MAVTLKQIAEEAGVSIPTVHQILNSYTRKTFSDSTRKRVLATAEKLNYRPNIAARSLVAQRSFLVGVLFNGVNNSLVTSFMRGLQESVLAHRCSPIFLTHLTAAEEAQNLRSVLDRRVDGLIVNSAIDKDGAMNVNRIVAAGVPVVEVFGLVVPGAPKIVFDPRASAKAMAERLIAEGHKRVALLIRKEFTETRNPDFSGVYWTATRFWQGYMNTMKAAGLRPHVCRYSGYGDGTPTTSFYRRVSSVLPDLFGNLRTAPTAVVCYTDAAADSLIRYFESTPRLEKHHLAVALADNAKTAESDRVQIHRFPFPVEEAGRAAGEALFDRIAGKPVEDQSFAPITQTG